MAVRLAGFVVDFAGVFTERFAGVLNFEHGDAAQQVVAMLAR